MRERSHTHKCTGRRVRPKPQRDNVTASVVFISLRKIFAALIKVLRGPGGAP